ncbi:MAG: hypothetical protein AB1491_04005 [Thermodesulfobacteriota bacterium]
MPPKKKDTVYLLLVVNDQIRNNLLKLLQENNYSPIAVTEPNEILRILKGHQCATVFLDCGAVSNYGTGICSKLKVACLDCRVVLLCDKSQESHRDIAREVMDIGIYACLWVPYEGWEVLTLVRHTPGKKQPKKKTPKKMLAN